ncbi:MAG: response regulator [Verrucomicrobiales bacterium]|jgi:signal transduction histidine kinase/DNA-binding response OmpR family regulator|nr:response regulator [Verrucomicrobiales bacterium]
MNPIGSEILPEHTEIAPSRGGEYVWPDEDRFADGHQTNWLRLVDHAAVIPADYNLEQVQNYFREHPHYKYAAVLDGEEIAGLCSELAVTRLLSMRGGLGFAVYAKTAVVRHIDRNSLRISKDLSILEGLNQVMSRKEDFFDDVILADGEGKYLGLISVQTLMLLQHRISHLQLWQLQEFADALNHNNAELAVARDQALQAAESKSSFLANMSHEIRTPLNGILGMIKILMRTALSPDQRKYSTTVLNSANALLTILNDILDFSKIEAGKMRLESIDFDLADIVEEVVQLLGERAREKKIELFTWIDVGVSTKIKADPTRLRQVLLNLISNAIKFTDKGEVVIRIRSVECEQGYAGLRVQVQDTGIGISQDAQDRLFGAFEQADHSTGRRYGGTGLGLAICKKIIELFGGSIGVESQLGIGSTFWFEIAVPKQTLADGTAEEAEDKTNLWGLRVLLVSESEAFGAYLGQHLRRWNTVFRNARNGKEALELLDRQNANGVQFECICIDSRLPDMSSLELSKKLRDANNSGRVILFTSFQDEIKGEQAREAGIFDLIAKPIKPVELRDSMLQARSGHERRLAKPVQVQETATDPAEQLPPLHLLLVEDSLVNQEVAILLLEGWGHRVDVAGHGLEALEKLRHHRYDGILMDCQMPEMDGYEATKTIRNTDTRLQEHDTYIIAMTANAMPGDRERCLDCGMNEYLGKPIEEDELVSALKKCLQHLESSGKKRCLDGAVNISKRKTPEAEPQKPVQTAVKNSEEEPYFPERLINLFIQETETRLEELKRALAQDATSDLRRIIHTIKGTAANFRANELHRVTLSMEERLHAGDNEAIPVLLIEAREAFRHTKERFGRNRQDREKPVDNHNHRPKSSYEPVSHVADEAEEPYFPARLVELFITETGSRILELGELFHQGDLQQSLVVLHNIKGTVGNFRAKQLHTLVIKMESALQDSDLDGSGKLLRQIESEFKRVCVQLMPSIGVRP